MFEFDIAAQSGAARAGTLTLPHGTVETPVFMPVGTQGSVRTLSPNDLRATGATLVLANTYHLHVRPGEQIIEKLGALHRFMGWARPLLTDSGGFQVFSLAGSRRLDEDGVEFQSHVDGSRRTLTPERATEIQWTLGADIAMAFDHVEPGVDLFDCVAPTRNGRNGSAFTADGPVNIRNAEHREDPRPLDDACD